MKKSRTASLLLPPCPAISLATADLSLSKKAEFFWGSRCSPLRCVARTCLRRGSGGACICLQSNARLRCPQTTACGILHHIHNRRSLRSLRSSPFVSLLSSRAEQAWLGNTRALTTVWLPALVPSVFGCFATLRRDKPSTFSTGVRTLTRL